MTVMLKDVAHYVKTRIQPHDIEVFNYVSVETLLQNKCGRIINESPLTMESLIGFQKNDILLGNIRPYLKKIWLSDVDGGTNGDVLVIRITESNDVIPKYLYYVLSSDSFFHYNVQHSKGSKMPRGDKEAIMDYEFKLPPIDKQKEIVKILDNFTALTAELTAELTARKQQYEFYRDKLLSFDHLTLEEREQG